MNYKSFCNRKTNICFVLWNLCDPLPGDGHLCQSCSCAVKSVVKSSPCARRGPALQEVISRNLAIEGWEISLASSRPMADDKLIEFTQDNNNTRIGAIMMPLSLNQSY